jgi:shikimate kinase / 3-dehydroquinate synthase
MNTNQPPFPVTWQNGPVFVYGPPSSGKSTIGRLLAQALDVPFIDLDEEIVAQNRLSIPEIFELEGEAAFRERETAALKSTLTFGEKVVALGGGSLVDPNNRSLVEAAGPVLLLAASLEILLERLPEFSDKRPLLAGDLTSRLKGLLARRREHYASFPCQIQTAERSPKEIVWDCQLQLGAFWVSGMGPAYDVRVWPGGLNKIGTALQQRGLQGPILIVSDQNVAPHYLAPVEDSLRGAGFTCQSVCLPAGERYKTIDTAGQLWEACLQAGVERGSTILALGGGVIGDLAGFAAATYLRGVAWVGVPTSLLAMVDASLGGKTGVDLPQGKNLAGAFHSPRMVLADPATLTTLPPEELRSGLAEVVKAGIIADPLLFNRCLQGWETVSQNLDEIVRRAMAVKIGVIEQDPYEQGQRAALNLGHTIGHAVELASGYQLRHGEAVSVGLVAEAELAEKLGLARSGLAQVIRKALGGLGLPVEVPPGLAHQQIIMAMRKDKKRSGGTHRFALPVRLGRVQTGVQVEETAILDLLNLAGRRQA